MSARGGCTCSTCSTWRNAALVRWATAQDNRTLWLPDAIVAAMSRDPAAFGLVATDFAQDKGVFPIENNVDYGRLPHVQKERRSFHWSVDTVLAAHGDGKLGH